ncbi:MAG: hypothetical protein U0793_28135 [Gemmataceae bacterium]
MADLNLADRIEAEFSAVEAKVKKFQTEQVAEHQARQKRLEKLTSLFDELRAIWRPRLEILINKFGPRVKATPRLQPSTREAILDFQSSLAHVRLKLSASTDRDITKVILGYDLEIIPVLMRYTPHAEIEFPLDGVDRDAMGKWLDERIVEFVRTYLSLGENDHYLKEHMVEDPIAHVRFPSMAAGAVLDWQGRKYYFVGAETRREFEKQQGIK